MKKKCIYTKNFISIVRIFAIFVSGRGFDFCPRYGVTLKLILSASFFLMDLQNEEN